MKLFEKLATSLPAARIFFISCVFYGAFEGRPLTACIATSCYRAWPSCRSSSSSLPSSFLASSTASSSLARREVHLGFHYARTTDLNPHRSRRAECTSYSQPRRRLPSGHPHLHQCVRSTRLVALFPALTRRTVGLTYSVISPLILIFATIYFGFGYLIYKYKLLNVYCALAAETYPRH